MIKLVDTVTDVLTKMLFSREWAVAELSRDGTEGMIMLKARL